MGAPDINDSEKELIERMRGTTGVGSRDFDIAKAILDFRHGEKVSKQTKQLIIATWVLAFGTIGLFVATLALVYVTLGD